MARLPKLDTLSVKQLTELLGRVETILAARRKTELAATKARMVAVAAAAGFSIEDIFANVDRKRARAPLPVKFRNPGNPAETWTGRGHQPRWLVAELARRGGSRDDFRV